MGARRARAFPIAVLTALLVACGSGHPAARFTRADLDTIVLRPSDAPPGTAYVDGPSGYQSLASFARDDVELRHLRDDGFVVGHLALFLPADHVASTGAPSPLTIHSVIVQGIGGLFNNADGAQASLVRFADDLRTRQLSDVHSIPTDGLGEPAYGFDGATADGAHIVMYVWRVDNLVLAVSGSGDIAASEVRALAVTVNERTA